MEISRIHALPEEVVNQIAAGEVVERPASVVKELMENALDAGASRIEVQSVNGGKTSLLIRDNGCGMSEKDLEICYLPHTTSKLTCAEDLFRLATNGFRGEAVASIAAVSQLTITSRMEDAAEAHSIHLSGGVLDSKSVEALPRGTTFLVENLFFNAPVRKTFLRSDTFENSRILDTVIRLAMANPAVRIDYKVNGKDVFTGVEGNSLQNRIAEALGAGTARSMVPVDYEEANIRVSGFAVPPDALENKRSKLYFYVQNRPIWNPVMTKAVTQAYEPYGSSNAPVAVLFLEMDCSAVDVNVHPSKREVRFANENDVFLAVLHAVRDAFQKKDSDRPAIRIEDMEPPWEDKPFSAERGPSFTRPALSSGVGNSAEDDNALTKSVLERKPVYHSDSADDIVQDLFSLPENGNIIPLTPQILRPPSRMDSTPPPQFFQLANTYLVCEDSEGLLLIDQNAAHQRVLYERALDSLASETFVEGQELLFPEIVEFSAEECAFIPDLLPTLEQLGFHLELFGKNAYQLRGTPRELPFSRSVEALKDLIAAASEGDVPGKPSHDALAKAWARGNAVPVGKKLGTEEMTQLMASLLSTKDPMSSPFGRPTLMRLPIAEINRRFKR